MLYLRGSSELQMSDYEHIQVSTNVNGVSLYEACHGKSSSCQRIRNPPSRVYI
jgi:hypothetical protein